jgi:hypothetical protein
MHPLGVISCRVSIFHGTLVDWNTLTRHGCLIHAALSFDDESIGRETLIGFDKRDISNAQLLDRNVYDLSIASHRSRLWG